MIKSALKRKSQTVEDTLYNKRRRLIIEKGIEILENIKKKYSVYNLETYNPLFRNFGNITRWLNLTEVTTLKNRIDVLPKEFGTLPFLQRLNLSHNCLRRYGWLWLKEISTRKTLLFLDISNNSLPELSEYIWKLNALVELNISHNMLGRLPQGIENVRNLKILNLSHNLIVYLPAGICNLRLQTIDISMNPLESINPQWECNIVLPSLVQLAAKLLHPYCRTADTSFLSNKVTEYINRSTIENCHYCGKVCTTPYVFAARPIVPIFEIANNVIRQTSKMPLVLYEFCYCYPECEGIINW